MPTLLCVEYLDMAVDVSEGALARYGQIRGLLGDTGGVLRPIFFRGLVVHIDEDAFEGDCRGGGGGVFSYPAKRCRTRDIPFRFWTDGVLGTLLLRALSSLDLVGVELSSGKVAFKGAVLGP